MCAFRAFCAQCLWPLGAITGVPFVLGTRVMLVALLGSRTHFCFFEKRGKAVQDARTLQAEAWVAGAAVQQCCVPCGDVCCWCLPRGRAKKVRLACQNVHGRVLVWVWLGVSLRLG